MTQRVPHSAIVTNDRMASSELSWLKNCARELAARSERMLPRGSREKSTVTTSSSQESSTSVSSTTRQPRTPPNSSRSEKAVA